MSTVTHIAGYAVVVNGTHRQLCAWCGETIDEAYLGTLAVPDDQPHTSYPSWETGVLVHIDGNVMVRSTSHDLPDDFCGHQL